MNIVLLEPEIPANTGNIGRTCVATGTKLHLIEPLGFRLDEKSVKRSGMDYWQEVDVTRYINYPDFLEKAGLAGKSSSEATRPSGGNNPSPHIWYATTKAKHTYTEVSYGPNDYIMFGKESAGIPEEILVLNEPFCIRIPMLPDIRSLNLSNSVAIVLYEALRQQRFAGLAEEGQLHRLKWS
ncbi:MAG: tRNA (cytidine(34)-2'-O)-methyltransferase [Lachnospiraceae bacterium]|nr:tRNA (cytidine(34)-2'-O)-methyltransferase [Lachnospiraceae bacterium]